MLLVKDFINGHLKTANSIDSDADITSRKIQTPARTQYLSWLREQAQIHRDYAKTLETTFDVNQQADIDLVTSNWVEFSSAKRNNSY